MAHCFEGSDTKWLGNARHDIEICERENALNIFAAQKACEGHATSNPQFRGHLDHCCCLIARSCHNEAHILFNFENSLRRAYEIFGSLLHRDSAKIEHDSLGTLDALDAICRRLDINSVINNIDLVRRDAVTVHKQISSQHADSKDADCGVHSSTFNVVYGLVDMFA